MSDERSTCGWDGIGSIVNARSLFTVKVASIVTVFGPVTTS
jgi:hypothetical protein